PGSMSVLAGVTFVSLPVSGISPTAPGSPVTVTASSPGWLSTTMNMDVVTPTFYFYPYGVQSPRTTLSAPNPVTVSTNTPGCGLCDVANADITVHFAVTGSPASIVTVTPSVTLHQDGYQSEDRKSATLNSGHASTTY